MPSYEWRCKSCWHPFTKTQTYSAPIPPCPSCGSGHVHKTPALPASTRVGKYGKGGGK